MICGLFMAAAWVGGVFGALALILIFGGFASDGDPTEAEVRALRILVGVLLIAVALGAFGYESHRQECQIGERSDESLESD